MATTTVSGANAPTTTTTTTGGGGNSALPPRVYNGRTQENICRLVRRHLAAHGKSKCLFVADSEVTERVLFTARQALQMPIRITHRPESKQWRLEFQYEPVGGQ